MRPYDHVVIKGGVTSLFKKPLQLSELPFDLHVYTELVIWSEEIKTSGGHTIVCLQQKRCCMKSKHTVLQKSKSKGRNGKKCHFKKMERTVHRTWTVPEA